MENSAFSAFSFLSKIEVEWLWSSYCMSTWLHQGSEHEDWTTSAAQSPCLCSGQVKSTIAHQETGVHQSSKTEIESKGK